MEVSGLLGWQKERFQGGLKLSQKKENNEFVPVLTYIKLLWISCNCFFTQSSFSACLKDYRYLMFSLKQDDKYNYL